MIAEVGVPKNLRSLVLKLADWPITLARLNACLADLRDLCCYGHSFELAGLALPRLRSLELITDRRQVINLEELRRADLRSLDRLALWLGVRRVHDCDIAVSDVVSFLGDPKFANVTTLGLCGRDPLTLVPDVLSASIFHHVTTLELVGRSLDSVDASYLARELVRLPALDTVVVSWPSEIAPLEEAGFRVTPDDRVHAVDEIETIPDQSAP